MTLSSGTNEPRPLSDLMGDLHEAMRDFGAIHSEHFVTDTPLCYLGHEDCYDRHEAERLADEADWSEEV